VGDEMDALAIRRQSAKLVFVTSSSILEGVHMNKNSLIAIDLAKSVFQVCVLVNNKVMTNKTIRRSQLLAFIAQQKPQKIFMEACYSSHYWAREFIALKHQVFLIPAQHVKPFVRGNKNDQNDALAIAEAGQRPNIKFVPVKTIEQQDIQMLHRIRDKRVAQRTGLINQTRGILSEYGVVAPKGVKTFGRLLSESTESNRPQITPMLREQLWNIREEFEMLCDRIEDLNERLRKLANTNPLARRLMTIPGIGSTIATALVSAIGNAEQFTNARELSVWLGVTPGQHASGTTNKLGSITKRGSRYLRKQVVHGARAALYRCDENDQMIRWAREVARRRGPNKATVALANRMMRLVWVLLRSEQDYKANPAQG
jgi:transposase